MYHCPAVIAFKQCSRDIIAHGACAGRALQDQQKFEAALIHLHQAVKAAAGGLPGSRHNFALGELLIRLGHLPEGSYYLQVRNIHAEGSQFPL